MSQVRSTKRQPTTGAFIWIVDIVARNAWTSCFTLVLLQTHHKLLMLPDRNWVLSELTNLLGLSHRVNIHLKSSTSTCNCNWMGNWLTTSFKMFNWPIVIRVVWFTSFSEFILALKCGDCSMRRAISRRSSSKLSTSCGHTLMHNNFIDDSKSDTLPILCMKIITPYTKDYLHGKDSSM